MDDEKNMIPEDEEFDEESGIVELTDEDGEVTRFEYLTTIEYENEEYVVLAALDEDEEAEDNGEEQEVVILKIEQDEETGEDIYVTFDDEAVSDAVFEKFLAAIDEEDESEE